MDSVTDTAIIALMNVYAKYFVEDFALDVIGQVKASFPIDEERLKSFVTEEVRSKFTIPVNIDIVNPVTRFLCEVATYAVEQGYDNKESRFVYDEIKNLPSIHHEEINQLIFASAALYKQTIDQTLVGVICSDAQTISKSILNAAVSRTSSTNTGGTLHYFNWGILSDGLWLNGALVRAYELASIFRPGDEIVAYYATVGFNFARNYAAVPVFGDDGEGEARGYIDQLISSGNVAVINTALEQFDQGILGDLLFTPGVLSRYIDEWQLGLKYPTYLIQAVSQLTTVAIILNHLIDTSKSLSDELTSAIVNDRLVSAYNAVTLCLVAFEALRETMYGETIIVDVIGQGNDPLVDVFVNQDLLHAYKAAGGTEDDLIKIGVYVDPRKGLPAPTGGWKMDWVFNRRDDIVVEVITQEEDRLTALRHNDAAVIQDVVINKLRQVITSYADAAGVATVGNDIILKINEIARKVTNTQEPYSLEQEIVFLLTSVIGDPFLTQVSKRFADFAGNDEVAIRQDARPLAVAQTAIDDAIGFLVNEEG